MIRVSHADAITTITFDRPDKRNALTPDMLAALDRAITSLPAATRALLLNGSGSAFCAGFDLALCAASPDGSVMRELLTGLSRAIASLRACPVPVIIAAHGAAIAGGCALLGGADVVIANREARFGYPVLTIGVSPAISGPAVATRMGLGPTRTRMLDTELITGGRAHQIGLVHELVDRPEDVGPHALAIAADLAAKPPTGMSNTKRWLNEIESELIHADNDRALAASMSLTGSEEERIGIAKAMQRK